MGLWDNCDTSLGEDRKVFEDCTKCGEEKSVRDV